MTSPADRELGVDRRITRRDFLNGIALSIGAGLTPAAWLQNAGFAAALEAAAGDYPPALTGLRGSHIGSFEAFHQLRDDGFWSKAGTVEDTSERYDLAVVGGGISGLAAAHFYRARHGGRAKILILDNHDDFGGHAKRNEFTANRRTYVGYGGTQSIDSPSPYSTIAKSLIREIGIDVASFERYHDGSLFGALGLEAGFFFDKETFGVDRLVAGYSASPDRRFLDSAPVADRVKRDLERLIADRFDPFPAHTSPEKKAQLARTSYAQFLTGLWKVDPGVLPLFQTRTHGLFGVGIDAVPAQDAWGLGMPGFQGMDLAPGAGPGQNYDSIRNEEAQSYYFHFPDGNATVARLLVRSLIPAAIPGRTAEDVVTARADYNLLDRPESQMRVRLSSTVMRVRDLGKSVQVTYIRDGKLQSVEAAAVVLACWHTAIPYLCPDLPARQREALAFAVKVPLVYTNVLVRNWRAFVKLGVRSISCPGLWHTSVALDAPVSIGTYRCSRSPAAPIVLHLSKAPCQPGLPVRMQHRAGRTELLSTPFEDIERSIRDQLVRTLGPGGFEPVRDVLAITVNRWPHGYAYQYNSLFDDFWRDGGEQPCVVARQRFGRIAIANADAAAYSYTDAAIDQAHRAVEELAGLEP